MDEKELEQYKENAGQLEDDGTVRYMRYHISIQADIARQATIANELAKETNKQLTRIADIADSAS